MPRPARTQTWYNRDMDNMVYECRPWTNEELEYLKRNWYTMRAGKIARELKRTKNSIIGKANRLNLQKRRYLYERKHAAQTSNTPV